MSSPEISPRKRSRRRSRNRNSTDVNHLRRQAKDNPTAQSSTSPRSSQHGATSSLARSQERPIGTPALKSRPLRHSSDVKISKSPKSPIHRSRSELQRIVSDPKMRYAPPTSSGLRHSGERTLLERQGSDSKLKHHMLRQSGERTRPSHSPRAASPRRSRASPRSSPSRNALAKVSRSSRIEQLKAELRENAKKLKLLSAKAALWDEHKKTCAAAAAIDDPTCSTAESSRDPETTQDNALIAPVQNNAKFKPKSPRLKSSKRSLRTNRRSRLVQSSTIAVDAKKHPVSRSAEKKSRNSLRRRRYSGTLGSVSEDGEPDDELPPPPRPPTSVASLSTSPPSLVSTNRYSSPFLSRPIRTTSSPLGSPRRRGLGGSTRR